MSIEWQPIETAPKDGTEILLCVPIKWEHSDSNDERIGKGEILMSAWWNKQWNCWQNRLDNRILPKAEMKWTLI